MFDKKFRFFKRQYKKQSFTELSESAENNPADMWARLKRLCDPPSTRAALEIVREDGSISTDMQEILERWYTDIARLFSGLRDNPDMAYDDNFYNEILSKKQEFENLSPEMQENSSIYNTVSLNSNISYDEVSNKPLILPGIKKHISNYQMRLLKTKMQKPFFILFSTFALFLDLIQQSGTPAI